MSNRRTFLTTLAAAAAAPGFGRLAPERRPNFVFILADDLGWGDLHCYGHPRIKTPNLDRMAAEGMLFTQFYVSSPVCSPSRATFMTGRFPGELAIHGHLATPPESRLEANAERGMPNFLDPAVIPITKILHDSGYRTGFFGKWHLGKAPDAPPLEAYGIERHKTVDSNEMSWQPHEEHFATHSTEILIGETIKFMERNREQPFFVQASLLDVHARLRVTEEQMEPYRNMLGAPRIYYSAVTRVDEQIGRLMASIDQLGLRENTVVLFTSDNGPDSFTVRNAAEHAVGSAGPFRGRKTTIYEGGVRMPFIVRCPGLIAAGKVDNWTIVSAADFLPTLCSMAHAKIPDGLRQEGEDISSALSGKPYARRTPLFWEWRFPMSPPRVIDKSPQLAIRQDRWKLLMNPDRSRVELYDIPKDPSELNNVAGRHPAVVNELSARLLAWQGKLPKGPVSPEAGKNTYRWPQGR